MGHGRGYGGAGRTILWGLNGPCGGVGSFWDQEGKETAGARVEVPWLDFFIKMK